MWEIIHSGSICYPWEENGRKGMRDIKAAKPIEHDYLSSVWLREKDHIQIGWLLIFCRLWLGKWQCYSQGHKTKKGISFWKQIIFKWKQVCDTKVKITLDHIKPSLLISWFMRSFIVSF